MKSSKKKVTKKDQKKTSVKETKNPKKNAAKDLLELERLYQQGVAFNDDQSKRWHELVLKVFGEQNSQSGRRSFRLPAGVPCTVKIGEGKFQCKALEISRKGILLEGLVLRHITHDHEVRLLEVKKDAQVVGLDLPCSIVRLEPIMEPPRAGLTFSSEAQSQAHKIFFDEVYYPYYVKYLEDTSA